MKIGHKTCLKEGLEHLISQALSNPICVLYDITFTDTLDVGRKLRKAVHPLVSDSHCL